MNVQTPVDPTNDLVFVGMIQNLNGSIPGGGTPNEYAAFIAKEQARWKEVVIKGQKMWDDTDRIAFLHAMVEKDILPKLPKQEDTTPASSAQQSAEELATEMKGDLDDF